MSTRSAAALLTAVAATSVLGVPAALPGVAAAAPSPGVTARTLSESTVAGVHYVTRELVIPPGGSTGWHWHPGQVYAVIRAGTLTHFDADCGVDGVYPTGGAITETSGPGYVHVGRNLGPDPLVLWAGYIVAAGEPLAVDAPNPGCPFE